MAKLINSKYDYQYISFTQVMRVFSAVHSYTFAESKDRELVRLLNKASETFQVTKLRVALKQLIDLTDLQPVYEVTSTLALVNPRYEFNQIMSLFESKHANDLPDDLAAQVNMFRKFYETISDEHVEAVVNSGTLATPFMKYLTPADYQRAERGEIDDAGLVYASIIASQKLPLQQLDGHVYRADPLQVKETLTDKTLLTDHAIGDFGTQINFDHDPITQIGQYESQGYKLVSNSYGDHAHQFSATASDNCFEVHLIHGMKDVVRTSTVNRVINYVDSATGEKLRPSTTQTLTFTEHGVTDEVTGETTWTDVPVQHFAKIATPEIEGYTTDMKTVDAATVQFGDADLEVNVPYTKVVVPDTPATPATPSQPGTPGTPSQPGTPQVPEQPSVSTARQANHAQPAAANATELPQTGDDSQHGAALAGLGLIGMIGAFFGFKKKREPKN